MKARLAPHLQRARTGAGLVLFAFVATHLLNHALGNISLEAMEAGRKVFLAVWRNPLCQAVFYAAIAFHLSVAIYTLVRRRRLKMPVAEAVQICFGFLIILALATHFMGTAAANGAFEVNDTYVYVILATWVQAPMMGLLQAVGLILVWTHGCIGIHFWLRLKPGYPPWRYLLLALAVLVPAAALSGFAAAGKEISFLLQDPLWLERQIGHMNLPTDGTDLAAWVYGRAEVVRWSVLGVIVAILLGRLAVQLVEISRGRITVTYPDGRRVVVDQGHSVLEASRAGGIPHASVCGGRGRCSTCRVRVVEGERTLPQPSEQELKVLARVGAAEGVRLACQLRPLRDVMVTPLLPPNASPRDAYGRPRHYQGAEREIAILFADIRAFTNFADQRLPYDVVFVINQYFRAMGDAVEQAGGRLDKFIGDGVMALFGVDGTPEEGARQALAAAANMSRAMDELNERVMKDMGESLRIGIGIHLGAAVVGEMGYRRVVSVTAIGDAVNTASRLEPLTKDFGCELVVSADLAARAGADLSAFPSHQVEIRGVREAMTVYAIPRAQDLPTSGSPDP